VFELTKCRTFTTNKRPDALMNNLNTSYLATCCRALHSQMEYPTDELVVHLVRTQQLSQSVSQAFARLKAVPDGNQPSPKTLIQGLRERIQKFAAALPPHIRANRGCFSLQPSPTIQLTFDDSFLSRPLPRR
jgi:hypothetical protein